MKTENKEPSKKKMNKNKEGSSPSHMHQDVETWTNHWCCSVEEHWKDVELELYGRADEKKGQNLAQDPGDS